MVNSVSTPHIVTDGDPYQAADETGAHGDARRVRRVHGVRYFGLPQTKG